jgi:hypothetical protein
VSRNTSRDAVVAHNPDVGTEGYQALYGERAAAVADIHLGQLFGVEPARFGTVKDAVGRLFQPGVSAAEVRRVCGELRITVLVAKSTDPVWQDRTSWVWGPAAYANDAARVLIVPDH